MGTQSPRCDAVLIFEKRRLFDGDVLERMANRILAAKGHEVKASTSEGEGDLTLSTRDFTLSIRSDGASEGEGLMGRLMIAITGISAELHADTPLVLLAEICRKAIMATEASQIVWLRKDVVFSAQQFLSAFGPVRPRRVARKAAQRPAPRRSASGRAHQEASQRLPHIAVTEERLDREFQELQTAHELSWTESFTDADEAALAQAIRVDEHGRHDAEPDVPLTRPTRITTWIMTAMIGLFSWPVAAGMATINLLRGEDFRLSAHALALTGSFATLDQIGATQQAMIMVFG
jgi:hypothetical protein